MGLLVAIEGIDGSGKGTQAGRLVERLDTAGHSARLFSFPRYSQTHFGAAIAEFLNGGFGPLSAVDPQLAATLFAGDRFETRDLLLAALADCEVVVCDRYVPSNLAHQGARAQPPRRSGLLEWIEQLEYDVFQLPPPDRVIWLDLPADTAQTLIARKEPRDYTSRDADLQEADLDYQASVRKVYGQLAADNPRWKTVDMLADLESQSLRRIEEIAEDIWDDVAELLEASRA